MSKKEFTNGISRVLGISEPESNGGTITKDWIIEMLEQLPIHFESPELFDKQNLLKKIVLQLGLNWDDSCVSAGSTLTMVAFERIHTWTLENIEKPILILELKEELIQSIMGIYDALPQDFATQEDWYFEENLFDKFGSNWTWMKSFEPIWKALNPSNFEVKWAGDGELIKTDVCLDLGFNTDLLDLDLMSQISAYMSVSLNHILSYNEFIEADEVSQSKAMEQWNELWDVSEDEREIIEPIIAHTDSWTIGTFAKYAIDKKLDTDPIYQREFVWSNTACQMLINSILMGIPLPSVILHETLKSDGSKRYQIIDGKQRLTSILRFTGSLPKARNFMREKIPILINSEGKESLATYDSDYLLKVILADQDPANISEKLLPRYRKWHRNKIFGLISDKDKIAKKQILPFALRKNEFQDVPALEVLNGLFYHEMRDVEINILGSKVTVSEIFEETSDYKIPVIIYDKDTKPSQIRRVFNRYNTQGTKLNATEVNNAAYQDVPAMRLTLALTRVKPERGEELIPGLYDSEIKAQSEIIDNFFTACNLSSKRFEWAKLMSVIMGLLYTRVDKKSNGKFNYLSTAKLIKTFFDNESNENHIKMNDCNILGNVISSAASSLHSELLFDLLREHPYFSSKNGTPKWGQPAAISVMVGAILCHSSGINVSEVIEKDDDVYEKMDSFLQTEKAMGQTQSDLQWKYYAEIITKFCAIFHLNKDNFSDDYNLYSGYNLLQYLHDLNQDNS